ncbi:anti-sigma factor family protein [Tumebacillus flagellatus]|uniref:DUF4830 domain-containing protein n=1 Tax=Tumebacillus flagellatus TaxID=1157490 RepID=A0A074LR67_9BACL|nr:DUF4830 domain-containing protein [Tumebacillus flagellatus]KEO83584.1 hypothetical protein EL26_09230 [Tumebacillus flagellatus]
MTCKEIQELMWCGEITQQVQEHLQTCERCRAEQATLQELGLAVEAVPIPKPSRSLLPSTADIQAAITAHKRRRFTKWLSAGAVAACLALALTQIPSLLETGKNQSDVSDPSLLPQTTPKQAAPVEQIQTMLGTYHYTLKSQEPSIVKTTLPASFAGSAQGTQENLYYAYANVLSQEVNLDMTTHLGHEVDVYSLPLNETFAGGRIDGYQDCEVVAVFDQNRLVGIWLRTVGGSAMAAIDNKLFGEITNQLWGEWAKEQKLETRSADTVSWTPDQVITKYLDANNRGDHATMGTLLSLNYQFYLMTNGAGSTTSTPIVTGNYYGPMIEPNAKYQVKFVEDIPTGTVDATALFLVRNRQPYAMKTYEVDGGPNAMFFYMTQESKGGPWQIDNISTGP